MKKKKITNIRDSKITIAATSAVLLILFGLSIGSNFKKSPYPNPIIDNPNVSQAIPDDEESRYPNWIEDNPTSSVTNSEIPDLDPEITETLIIESDAPVETTGNIINPLPTPTRRPIWILPTLDPTTRPSFDPIVPSATPGIVPSADPSSNPTASSAPIDPPYNQGGQTECTHWLHGEEFNENGELYCWLCHKWVEIPGLKPKPSQSPSPSAEPSSAPSEGVDPTPTASGGNGGATPPPPSKDPSPGPSASVAPSPSASVAPSPSASVAPSPSASVAPSPSASVAPSPSASVAPSPSASVAPSSEPSVAPSAEPSVAPSAEPSYVIPATPAPTPGPRPTPAPVASAEPEPVESPEPVPTPGPRPRMVSIASVKLSSSQISVAAYTNGILVKNSQVLDKIEKSRRQMQTLLALVDEEKQSRNMSMSRSRRMF